MAVFGKFDRSFSHHIAAQFLRFFWLRPLHGLNLLLFPLAFVSLSTLVCIVTINCVPISGRQRLEPCSIIKKKYTFYVMDPLALVDF